METATEWYSNESFWKTSYDFMFPAERIESSDGEVANILKLCGGEARTALDLCCGPGRMSVALAKRGIRTTGVDLSTFLLDKAKARAGEAGVEVEWVREDMRRFVRAEAFDLAINVFTSFGYFAEPEENLRVLENVQRSLRPGGCFVIELMNKERLAHVFESTLSTVLPDGRLFIDRHRVVDGWQQIQGEWYFLEDGRYQVFRHRHFIYSGQELRALLLQAGFAEVALYGGFEGAPFDGWKRLVAVARR
jgi:SAM-dependent methyltransferase